MDTNGDISKAILIKESKSKPSALKNYAEFPEGASSDWSHFTSSDDSSFTTESTRDSFSALDHGDVPFSTVFQSLYPAESTSRRAVSSSKGQTRFARLDSGLVQSTATPTTGFLNSGNEARTEPPQTSVNCSM